MNFHSIKTRLKVEFISATKTTLLSLPVLVGSLLLLSLIDELTPDSNYIKMFTGNTVLDAIKGGVLGSILGGDSVVSYVLGKTLIDKGVSMVAVTAFITTWVTVGISQLPIEASYFGWKFAFLRNGLCFGLSLIVAILTVLIYNQI